MFQSRTDCHICYRSADACLCAEITCVDNQWPVVVVQHRQEVRHALGTAIIAKLGLTDNRFIMADDQGFDIPAELSSQFSPPALIYPGEAARNIEELIDTPPRPLLFLDASWRKSRRLLLGSPWLQSLPRYSFANSTPSRYRIRREPSPGQLSTLEAIVQVLGVLEQRPSHYAGLLATMDAMIDRQISRMGLDTYARNYPGD